MAIAFPKAQMKYMTIISMLEALCWVVASRLKALLLHTLEKYHHFDRIRPVLLGAFLFRQVVNQLADCTSFSFVLCTFGILSVNKELCFTVFLRKALQ